MEQRYVIVKDRMYRGNTASYSYYVYDDVEKRRLPNCFSTKKAASIAAKKLSEAK